MPTRAFLDAVSFLYLTHQTAWKRDERRLQGGDAILGELVPFAAEDTTSYAARQAWARWIGFGRVHTTILAGHIRRAMPAPDYGPLGDVNTRGDSSGSLAEAFHYNCDGVGSDGQQLDAFLDGVEQRALATGFRWLMVEMPTAQTLDAIRRRLGGVDGEAPVTEAETRAGFRPYLVEYSPLAVTNWRIIDGVLVWAVLRVPVDPASDLDVIRMPGLGYYLLVRAGYQGLGPEYAAGGWWKYDAQQGEHSRGTWDDTGGDIPLWMHVGEPGRGTYERPSIGLSSTMELGQISADLMNAVSEQRFNLRQAAKSINYWIGIDALSDEAMKTQLADGSISVAVPMSRAPDGTFVKPELVNSSGFALDAEAYQGAIDAALGEAREIMVRQVTSEPGSSGASKMAGFAEATSPLLARLAATAEQSINTLLYFVGRRFGLSATEASGMSVSLNRDFSLRDAVADIDTMLGLLKDAGQRSPTWERALLTRKGEELEVLPNDDADRQAVEAELSDAGDDKANLERIKLQAEAGKALIEMGASEAGAAAEVGFTPEEIQKLFGPPMPEDGVPQPVPPAPIVEQPAALPEPAAPPVAA